MKQFKLIASLLSLLEMVASFYYYTKLNVSEIIQLIEVKGFLGLLNFTKI